MASETSHFWPGGIPSSLRIQPERDMPHPQLQEECKAWLLFVSVNWTTSQAAGISGDASDYDTRQRRELVLKWAEADQSFRDSYHDRAPTPRAPKDYPRETMINPKAFRSYSLLVLPRVDSTNPINRVHWTKILLLFNRFDGPRENFLADDGTLHPLVLAGELPSSPVDIADAARWMFLENANFPSVSMTRSGTVMFCQRSYFFVVDQKNLDEGTISIVTYALNGEIEHEVRTRPYFLRYLLGPLGDSTPLPELPGGGFEARDSRVQIDINAPMLEILESAKAEDDFAFCSPRFAEDVEYYAPGYLAMEAEGRAAEYDPEPLTEELC